MKRIVTTLLLVLSAFTVNAQQKSDIMDFRPMDPESCCYELAVENSHTPESPLNYIRLRILTPGVTFQPGAGGPWPTSFESDTMVVFGDGGIQMLPRESLEGFNACFQFSPGLPRTFRVEWRVSYNNTVTTIDTVDLNCVIQQRSCDTVSVVSVSIPGQPEGSCAYEFTLKNIHEPMGDLNGFRLVLQTPGASMTGTATGPWDVLEQNANSVSFGTNANILNPGADLGGFRIFVLTPQGNPGNVIIRWISSHNGQILCENDVIVNCVPKFNPRGDTLLMRKLQDCSYDMGIINKHVPRSSLNNLRLSVITPGASITSVSAAPGWTIASQTGLNVQFSKSGTVLATGDSSKGFIVTFKASSSGLVRFAWATYNGANVATRDTVQVQCVPPAPVVCDSLIITPQAAACTYDFGFVNSHQPASAVNEFHLRLQNPGATISDVVAPANWVIQSRTSTEIVFEDTSGVITAGQQQTGFVLTLTPADAGDQIVIEHCTALDGSVHCCEFATVQCAPVQERCDSLSISSSTDYCSYVFSISNLRVPNEDFDAWRLSLDDSAAVLWSAEAPAGWTLDTLDEQMLRFVKNSGVVATGETADGFVLNFVPSAASRQIPFTWCTELAGQDRCCDTASVACEAQIVQCDVIDVVTSTESPCCFDFSVQNVHLPRGLINGFNVQIITPGVTLFTGLITSPDGWTYISNSTRVGWRRTDGAILPGETLDGFAVCYDNSGINNADFQIVTQTVENGLIICQDTLTIKCDRTLSIELLSASQPGSFRLHQNFPNPFNPVTTIQFDLPQRSEVTLSLFDAQGRLVMDLGSGQFEAGSWQITFDASALNSGTYFYQLRTPEFSETKSLILLK
jgi:hypothetical protein